MSEYEALRDEIMTVLGSVNAYGKSVDRYADVVNEQVAKLWQDNAELRDELHAVANRLENLTRAVTTDPAEVAAAIVNDANRSALRLTTQAGDKVRDVPFCPYCDNMHPHVHEPEGIRYT